MGVREQVMALAEPLAEARGLVLVDVELAGERGRTVLRCVVHRPEGAVTLDDVEGFHRALDPLLDAADPIPDSYVLEVSSPGAERPLRTAREFALFAGRPVVLASRAAVDGRREWQGRLCGVDGDAVLVAFGPGEAARVAVPLEQVAWARLRLEEDPGLPRPRGRRVGPRRSVSGAGADSAEGRDPGRIGVE